MTLRTRRTDAARATGLAYHQQQAHRERTLIRLLHGVLVAAVFQKLWAALA